VKVTTYTEGPEASKNFERAMMAGFSAPKVKHKPKRRKKKPDKG
jgi:hypothetical protein